MLRFYHVSNLRDEDMRAVYRELTPFTLATALKNAPPEIADKFFENMPSNIAAMVKEVMQKLGEVPDTQIKEERSKVLKTVQALRAKRRIR